MTASAERQLLTLLNASGEVVAVCPALVRWVQKLTAPNELEEARIPWQYLKSDGTLYSKVSALEQGWYALWAGGKYVIHNVDTDHEDYLAFDGLSAEVDDLGNLYTNYSGGPATYLNMLPTDIANALLSGKVGRQVKNAGFGILDEDDLPTNWSHPTGWSSQLVSNRRVWQADAGTEESYSDDLPCTPGENYRVKLDIKAAGTTGTRGVFIRWMKADGSTTDSAVTALAVEDGAFHEVDTGNIKALGVKLRIVLYTNGTGHTTQFDDVRLYEIGSDSGYTYTGECDTRDALIPYTDGAIVRYGVWTEGASYLESTTAGDYVGRVVNGPFVTVCFAAGGAGARAKIRINGVQYQASGTSLVPGTTAIDVSAAVSLTASGLDPANDHIVEVEVAAVKVRVTGLTVSTQNLISMRWDDKTLYEALQSIAKAVGGELEFDPVAKTVYHHAARGQNLKTNNVVQFRRGVNISRMFKREARAAKIVNRLTYLGYGEGQYMLRVTVDATSVNGDGDTSQDVYGIRRGTYTNKECKNLATATAEAQRLVEESCWPQRAYEVRVTDDAAALCEPGDTGHFVYQDVNEELRILEIGRCSDGSVSTLKVARRTDPLVDAVVASGRQLSTLQKSYQGVPSDANDSFSEQFERTSGGTDVPATVEFFIPYGADLMDLRLRYQVGGMRSFAKAVGGGGGTNTPSGGGSTSGSGGGSTPTSNSVSTPSGGGSTTPSGGGSTTPSGGGGTTPSGGGSTSGSTTIDTVVSPGTSRNIAVADAYGSVVAPGMSDTYDPQWAKATIFNRTGSNLAISYEWRKSGPSGSLVSSGSGTLYANSVLDYSYDWSSYAPQNACFRAKSTTAGCDFDICVLIYGHKTHTHSTPSHAHSTPNHTHSTPDHTHSTPNHTHPNHSHTVTISDHTHSTPNHVHALPDHAHTLSYGIYESSAPATIRLYLDGTLISLLNDDAYVSDFDLLPYVRKDSNGRVAEGWHTLEWKSATNGATGSVRGTVFQRKFISTEAA